VMREFNLSPSQLETLPAHQYSAMVENLRVFPPGDMLTQRLIVDLIMTVEMFMSGFSDKKADRKIRSLKQIAPWLVTPQMERQQQRQKDRSHFSAIHQSLRQSDGD